MRPYDLYKERRLFLLHLALGGAGGGGGVVETTVTGILPLALINAVADELVSLTRTGKVEHALKIYVDSLMQYGKVIQNGTPTPDAYVDLVCNNGAVKWGASGTNLLDMAEGNIRLRYYINDSGVETSNNQNFYNTKFIQVKPNTTYTLSVSEPVYYTSIMEYDSNKGFLQRTLDGSSSEKHSSMTLTTRADTAYILIGSNSNRVTMNMDDVTGIDWMLNEGSTALPYEPYAEGIIADGTPEVLSVGAQTASVTNLFAVGDYKDEQDIISGAVNRKVGVKVLTGEETMNYASDTLLLTINDIIATGRGPNRLLCTHYRERTSGDYFVHHNYSNNYVYFHNVNITSLEDWRAFFAAQYAAGTPVIVIYPLAEETTESVTPQPIYNFTPDLNVHAAASIALTDSDFAKTSSSHTEPTPYAPLDLICNNGKIGESGAAGPKEIVTVSPYGFTAVIEDLLAVAEYADTHEVVSGAVNRKVGAKVLDGTETWGQKNATDGRIIMRLNDAINQASAPIIVTHGQWSTLAEKDSDKWRILAGPYLCCYSSLETTADFKAYLAAQYANGTPVIVIYPLAEEVTTSVVNQDIELVDGTNTITTNSAVSDAPISAVYKMRSS